jgi:hypothetical protein
MLDVFYYRDAQQGVYERAGLIRGDIQSVYLSSRELAPGEASFYVYAQQLRDTRPLERFGTVSDLGQGLFRVDGETR